MSSGYIEPGLSKEAQDFHRALASLQEELEAIDFYHQRADVSDDPSLAAVMAHNRDDEMEHAMMLLEWLRRTMPGFDVQMKKFLFTSGDIVALAAGAKAPAAEGSGLGPGKLK
jgi:ferritin-like protein